MMESMRIADIESHIDHELVSKQQIEDLIQKTAVRISKDYQGKDLMMVAVLRSSS